MQRSRELHVGKPGRGDRGCRDSLDDPASFTERGWRRRVADWVELCRPKKPIHPTLATDSRSPARDPTLLSRGESTGLTPRKQAVFHAQFWKARGMFESECYRCDRVRHGAAVRWATGGQVRLPTARGPESPVDDILGCPPGAVDEQSANGSTVHPRVAPKGGGARSMGFRSTLAQPRACYVPERWTLWIPACRLRLPAIQSCCRLSVRLTAPLSAGRWSALR